MPSTPRQDLAASRPAEREAAAADPGTFWPEKAEALEWVERWREALSFDPPTHRWFIGGS